jgi:FkbM family methyltransferase
MTSRTTAQGAEALAALWSLADLMPQDFLLNVIDVGAALGEEASYQPLVNTGRARVVGFEPDFEQCDALNAHHGPPHRFFPYFIGDGGPATFHETNWVYTGSLFEPNLPLLECFNHLAEVTRPVATHEIHTTRLDDIDEIGDVDFIKLDIQGAEKTVLDSSPRTLDRAVMVQAEVEFVELYKGQPLFADVDALLRARGFQFHTFVGFGGRAFRPLVVGGDPNVPMQQLLWADALYVRDWLHLEALSPSKLRAYAVLAHDLFSAFDLAHRVLTALDAQTGTALAAAYRERLSREPVPMRLGPASRGEPPPER